jgi:hypothetical protein
MRVSLEWTFVAADKVDQVMSYLSAFGTPRLPLGVKEGVDQVYIDGEFEVSSLVALVTGLQEFGIQSPKFTVHPAGFQDSTVAAIETLVGRMESVAQAVLTLTSRQSVPPGINIVTSEGFRLWHVQRVEVVEDSCTDVIDHMLQDGWRILDMRHNHTATTDPVKDSEDRRPTYIMGIGEHHTCAGYHCRHLISPQLEYCHSCK